MKKKSLPFKLIIWVIIVALIIIGLIVWTNSKYFYPINPNSIPFFPKNTEES